MKHEMKSAIKENREVTESLMSKDNLELLERIGTVIVEALKQGGKVLVFGNGGSAADSQHMVAELVGRYKKERRALPAVALTTNTSTITALSNDYSYDMNFARQIEALGRKGGIVLGISTSGNARSVIEGLKRAREMGLLCIGLTGRDGGAVKDIVDYAFVVKSDDTPRIQEAHVLVIHVLCGFIESGMCAA